MGTIVPMVTPIGDDRAVDTEALERFTESLADAGVHGFFPASSIGEFPSLTDEENRRAIETVTRAAGDDATVLAGCCDTSVSDTVAKIDVAAAAGADAAVVVTPYYLGTRQAGLERFFRAVADEASLPVLMYNIPSLTSHSIDIETSRSLANHERIIGLKDTSGSLTYHSRLIEETPEEFTVFQGATELATASLDVGTDGLIAGPANVFPEAMALLYEEHRAGRLAEARRLFREIVMPVVTATSDVPTAAALKFLLSLDGRDVGGTLPPLPELTAPERDRLAACYERVDARARVVGR
ncbi:dihydrodipicolinate synthase family protein [Salinigranum salinum]|uniref:dihydrodipicolinate synthase family protein n=1 Tax=Salinigranum salinum TaxID=1364937 RepID=UPI0023DAD344|nr:dihydrodipicolinate synthase family protein [Salinigranum salinum]